MIRLCALALALWALSTPAQAQEESCYTLGPTTTFCGKKAGWKGVFSSPVPGTFTFENQEFIFAITVQADHGQSISPALFDLAIEGTLRGMDQRTDQPLGTHRAEMTEVIRHDKVEGRRIFVTSVFEGTDSAFVMDVYFSSQHAWTTQTAHLGPITSDRLMRVHELTMQEVRLAK
jgi:hypothetical protein